MKQIIKVTGTLILLTVLSSCGISKWEDSILAEVAALPAMSGEFYNDVEYKKTATSKLQMDIYLPDEFTNAAEQVDTKYPVYVFIHGGAWIGGHRKMILLDENDRVGELRTAGIAVVTVSYRFLQEVTFTRIAEDISDAFTFMEANSALYHLDMNYVVVHGQSAGAHLALQYAFTHTDEENITIRGIVDEYGPTDLVALSDATPVFSAKGGLDNGMLNLVPSEVRFINSPINLVTNEAPPIFILHGDKDDIVPIDQSLSLKYKMEQLLDNADDNVQFQLVKNSGHGFYADVLGEDAILVIHNQIIDFIKDKIEKN